ATCLERYGRIDVLHNNVGIGAGDAGVAGTDVARFERILRVNLEGPLLVSKHALPSMRERRSGVITNVSSIASIASATGMVAYKTSKAALNALTQTLALANARYGVRANAILPGLINTPMAIEGISRARGLSRAALIAERDRQVPLGKMGTAWDVAAAALFLASDESKFITGVLLPVDGAQSARVGCGARPSIFRLRVSRCACRRDAAHPPRGEPVRCSDAGAESTGKLVGVARLQPPAAALDHGDHGRRDAAAARRRAALGGDGARRIDHPRRGPSRGGQDDDPDGAAGVHTARDRRLLHARLG